MSINIYDPITAGRRCSVVSEDLLFSTWQIIDFLRINFVLPTALPALPQAILDNSEIKLKKAAAPTLAELPNKHICFPLFFKKKKKRFAAACASVVRFE